jgi:formyl-CoA transferase
MTQLPGFEKLAKPEYEKNKGRIQDVKNLNNMINESTRTKTTTEMIDLCNKAPIAISKVNPIKEVIEDPYVKNAMLSAKDPITGTQIWMAPPPFMTPFLKESNQQMTFPPRFGEDNAEIYGKIGYSQEKLAGLKDKGVI